MAIRLSWQNTPAKSLVNTETGTYLKYVRISTTQLRRRLTSAWRRLNTVAVAKTAQRRERKGGCKAAGHPPAYSLRVNRVAQ